MGHLWQELRFVHLKCEEVMNLEFGPKSFHINIFCIYQLNCTCETNLNSFNNDFIDILTYRG